MDVRRKFINQLSKMRSSVVIYSEKGSFLGKSVRMGEMSEGMGWDVGGPDHGTSEGILNLNPRRKRGGYKYFKRSNGLSWFRNWNHG